MGTFKYTAQAKDGKMVSATIDAVSLNLAIDTLTASKLKILEIKPVQFSPTAWLESFGKVDDTALVLLTRRLATMLKTGLPMVRGLTVLYEQEEDRKLKPILMTILHDIRMGATLSWTLAKYPTVFSQLYISMVKVGETTGQMAGMLEKLSDFMERDLKIKKQAQAAMTYPTFIFVVCVLVVGFIFLYILPGLLDVFKNLGSASLPLPTQIIIWTVAAVKNPYVQLSVVVGGIYYYIYFKDYIKTPHGKLKFDTVILKLPLAGQIIKKVIVAQYCRALGILISTGIPLLKSMQVLMEFMENEYFRQYVCFPVYEGVKEGESLAQAMGATKFFPVMVVQMVTVGESTGEMSKMLSKISSFYDSEIVYAIDGFLTLLEPIMICGMGIVVCFILLAVFLPLYQVISKMG